MSDDGGKVEKPHARPPLQQPKAAEPAPAVGEHTPAGAGVSGVMGERKDAAEKVLYRMTGGARGTPPLANLGAQRGAPVRDAVARMMRKASGPPTAAPKIPQGGGAPLSNEVRARMEPKLGADLSGVRVHTGGDSHTAATNIGARAFTVGSDVHFNAGEFQPGTKEGDRLLGHELTHAVQAKNSGVQRKAEHGESEHAGGDDAHENVSKPGEPAEVEADAMGDHVADSLHDGGGDEKQGAGQKKKDGKGDGGDKAGANAGGEKHAGGDAKTSAAPKAEAPKIGAKLDPAITPKTAVASTADAPSKLYLKKDDAAKGGAKPKRDPRLGKLDTPNLDALAKLEGDAVYGRYLDDFDTYDKQSKAKNKQSKEKYLEGRAARKLGRSAERESIAAYGAKAGYGGGKSNKAVEILSNSGKVLRERIPDVFDGKTVVGDCKMVAEQALDDQMRDNVLIANAQNVRIKGEKKPLTKTLRFDLLVSGVTETHPTGTHVTQPLVDAVQDNRGAIWEITDK